MTAQKVDGKAVLAVEPVETPLSTPKTPKLYTRIVRLLLEDDSEVFGCCADEACDFTASKVGAVRSHIGWIHNPARKPWGGGSTKAPDTTVDVTNMTIGEVLALAESHDATASALERMTEDRNEWKGRARKAEASLATLKRVLS